jgi:hypothetical protein
MQDKALFYATLKVASSSFNGLGLALLAEATLPKQPILLITNIIIGILCLGATIYIERYLFVTYGRD